MPFQLFTEAERARRNRFPDVIAYEDLVTFFTLSERDLRSIPRSREPHNGVFRPSPQKGIAQGLDAGIS